MGDSSKLRACPVCWESMDAGSLFAHAKALHFRCRDCGFCQLFRAASKHRKLKHNISFSDDPSALICLMCDKAIEDGVRSHGCKRETMPPDRGEPRLCPHECGRRLESRAQALIHVPQCRAPRSKKYRKAKKKQSARRELNDTQEAGQDGMGGEGGDDDANSSWEGAEDREQSNQTQQPATSLAADESARQEYNREARPFLDKAEEVLRQLEERNVGYPGSGTSDHLPVFRKLFETCKIGDPLTVSETLAKSMGRQELSSTEWTVSNAEESRRLFSLCSPDVGSPQYCFHRPVLTRGGAMATRTIEDFREMLRMQDEQHFEVHDLAARPRRGAKYRMPRRMKGLEVLARLSDSHDDNNAQQGPINILSLNSLRQNPVPRFLDGLNGYSVLQRSMCPESNGKDRSDEMTRCSAFGLFATAGATSLTHQDRHGNITTAACEFGSKVWFLWLGISLEKKEQYARAINDGVIPDWPCVAVVIQAGDVLTMPPGTLHAVFSPEDVLMTGTMHWSAGTMVDTARAIAEVERSDWGDAISNEETAKVLDNKLAKVAALWDRSLDNFESGRAADTRGWGPREDLRTFEALLKISR